tara:strand:- start:149 stop:739 length:591 start_codon:yes stop_codon:yes gene_type:complete
MGMFDDIVVHRKLPLPKELPAELRDVKWKEVVFQTKCLDNCLTEYKIAINGKLYAQKFDDEGDVFAYNSFFDKKREDTEMFWKNVAAPTSIQFYTSFQKKEFDYWVSFTAFFDRNSKLTKITLDQLDAEDNSARKEQQKRFNEEVAANEKLHKKFIYKFYNIFWEKPLRYFWVKLFKLIKKFPTFMLWMERKIFPW